jgi:hypothetical protein
MRPQNCALHIQIWDEPGERLVPKERGRFLEPFGFEAHPGKFFKQKNFLGTNLLPIHPIESK